MNSTPPSGPSEHRSLQEEGPVRGDLPAPGLLPPDPLLPKSPVDPQTGPLPRLDPEKLESTPEEIAPAEEKVGPFQCPAWAFWLARGLGSGCLKPGPGTWGSLFAVGLAGMMSPLILPVRIAIVIALAIVSVPVCAMAARHLGHDDPGEIVFDEIVAVLLVFALCPFTWQTAILGFAFFRLFDILKPFPVSWGENFPGGWGIVADDLIAALYTALVLHLILPWLGTATLVPPPVQTALDLLGPSIG